MYLYYAVLLVIFPSYVGNTLVFAPESWLLDHTVDGKLLHLVITVWPSATQGWANLMTAFPTC